MHTHHRSFFTLLPNRDIVENGGVFVTRTRSLASLAPKSNIFKVGGTDLSKMNPALVAPTGGRVGSGAIGRGRRDRNIVVLPTLLHVPSRPFFTEDGSSLKRE